MRSIASPRTQGALARLMTMAILSQTLALAPMPGRAAEALDWQGRTGGRIQAEFLGLDGRRIRLRGVPDGRVYDFDVGELSPASQEQARRLSAGAAASPATPAAQAAPGAGAASGGAVAEMGTGGWPRTVSVGTGVTVTVVEENEGENRFVYQTEHFEFQCDARLGENVVREFARLFEATYALVKALPLGLDPQPKGERFIARLFVSKEDFQNAGGIPGSGGTYRGRERDILVPLASLGVKRVGKRYSIEDREDNETLIHELTHQMLNEWNGILPVWLNEGWAEFVASMKYSMGRYSLSQLGSRVVDALRRNRGMAGAKFAMVPVEQLFGLSHSAWGDYVKSDQLSGESARNYATALLVAYHFAQVDGDGTGTHLRAYMQALKEKVPEEEARSRHLLRGTPIERLEEEIIKGWRKEGLTLTSAKLKGAATEEAAR